MKVTINISEENFVDMVCHFAKDKGGRPVVGVYDIVSVEVEGDTINKAQLLDSWNDGSFEKDILEYTDAGECERSSEELHYHTSDAAAYRCGCYE